MGMMDKFRSFMGMPDEDDEDDYDYEYEEDQQDEREDRASRAGKRAAARETVPASEPLSYGPEHDAAVKSRSNKVVNIAATTQLSVVLVKPERFDDASSIADHLNAKRTVVLNLESSRLARTSPGGWLIFSAVWLMPTMDRSSGWQTVPLSSPPIMSILLGIFSTSWRTMEFTFKG